MCKPNQTVPWPTKPFALALLSSAFVMTTSPATLAADDVAKLLEIEEVVVTARRVEENSQTVPLTVTAITPLLMQKENIIRPTDLTYTVPSLTIAPSFNTLNNRYSIRGLAAGVATYFAESSCCTGNSSVPFMDIKSVAVLNGPQGTLFGRTSGSGAILIEPVRPNIAEAGASVKFRAGDYGRMEFSGAVNKPLIANRLGLRLAVSTINVDGFTKQIGGGDTLDEQKSRQVRLGIEFSSGRFENYTAANNTSNGKVVSQLGPMTEITNNDLQARFDVKDGLVMGTLGFYYTRSKDPATNKGTGNIYQIFGGVLNADLGFNSALDFSAGNRRSQRAWYTQATLDASTLGVDGLKLTAGYRYSWDNARTAGHSPVFDLATGSYSPSATLNESRHA